MRRLRFTIGQLMAAIALFALAFAVFPPSLAWLALVLLAMLVLTTLGISAWSGRPFLGVAAWVAVSYPILTLLSLYGTWLIAWVALGHRPRPSIDDPKSIGPVVSIAHDATGLCLMGFPPALLAAWVLVGIEATRIRTREPDLALRLAILPGMELLLWLGGFIFLACDPFNVLYWFMD